jgi:hypothetical protein
LLIGEMPLLEKFMISFIVAIIVVGTYIADFNISIRKRLANVIKNTLHVRSCIP